ncbi:MAG TPA: Zn-binding domain-containing protein, partial [Anaerolineaceae bacterium]|nr:Zn-binding domain-containing protein [Anaerolineaceae bacterium]
PDYFFSRPIEQALVNPDNLLILLQHLQCAAFELPFQRGEGFGRVPQETVDEFLRYLEDSSVLHASGDRFFWMADQYPANNVSLRSASPENVVLQAQVDGAPVTIGSVDMASAPRMVHPGAIYLHEGQAFRVESLSLEDKVAYLESVSLDYFTEPRVETIVQRISSSSEAEAQGCKKSFGEIQVTSQLVGFRKVRWHTHENLGAGEASLPPTNLQTTGYWLTLSEATVKRLEEQGLWTNAANDYGPRWPELRNMVRARDGYRCQVCGALEMGRPHHVHHKTPFRQFTSPEAANKLENLVTLCPSCHRRVETAVRMRSGLSGTAYALGQLAPFFLLCDQGDLGVPADPESPLGDGQPTIVLYDQVPAGIGLSDRLFELHDELIHRAYELVHECECTDGCPSCIGPAGENGVGGKPETLALLSELNVG